MQALVAIDDHRKLDSMFHRRDQLSLFAVNEPIDRVPAHFGRLAIGIREKAKAIHDVSGYWDRFDFTLNPYVGCGFGCSYCYAAFFVPDDQRREDWGTWVDVKTSAVREIRKRKDLSGKRVLMSSATDPYQPIERRIELTRGIVEALSDTDWQPVLHIQTRSPLVTRDIDLFSKLKKIQVNMSVTTDDDTIRKRFEPGCASIERRIEAICQVKAAGIPICICLAPMLPMSDPDRFADRIASIGPDHVYASPFNITDGHFKASTGSTALALAREYDWTRDKVEAAMAMFRDRLPAMK